MKTLVVAVLAAVLVSACGQPEVTASESQALNGYSVPPPGGWYPEPWICADAVSPYPAWLPTNNPWPMNPVNSVCQWKPHAGDPIYPYRVSTCSWSIDPIWSGTMYLYSGQSFTGSCAMIFADSYPAAAYQYDADLVEANGWHSKWTPPASPPQAQAIQSIKLGPNTQGVLCEGPFTGPSPGNPCNKYRAIGFGTGSVGTQWVDLGDGNGGIFEIAAIQIQATQ